MNLSLAEQVAQMIVVRASGFLFDHQIRYPIWEPPVATLKHWVADLGVGGVIFVDGSAVELAVRSQQIQSWAKIPLLMAADIEEGVGQRFPGATHFPPPMALGAIAQHSPQKAVEYAEKMGAITAEEALAIGLNWILAPVVDVNNNPQNPVINVRAFGETPSTVTQLATAFMGGCQSYPVLTTAKHFPGHGDTAVDSHRELPVIPHSPQRLAEVELSAFEAAIAQGVDGVMSAHILIPAWDAERPATLSKTILTEQLRQGLGFEGLIVTDALVMGAIANFYGTEEAAILALEAGADILLMPARPEATIHAICEAVHQGRISPERIQGSVERIAGAKAKVFPEWNSQTFSAKVAQPEIYQLPSILSHLDAEKTVEGILQDSLKVGGTLPLQPATASAQPGRNLIIIDDLVSCTVLDRQTPAIAFLEQFGYQLQIIHRHSQSFQVIPTSPLLRGDLKADLAIDTSPLLRGSEGDLKADLARETAHPIPTVLQLFIRGNPFRSSAEVTQVAELWFKHLLMTEQLQALVVYGSPYTLEQFLPQMPPNIPYVFSYGQMPTAQKLALRTLFGLSSTHQRNFEFL